MTPVQSSFVLPDLFATCTFPASVNPHYKDAGAESAAWIDRFNVFAGDKRAFFVKSKAELLVAHAYPYASYEEFRTVCDFMNILFVVDDLCDDLTGADARITGYKFVEGMRDNKFDDTVLSKITSEFRERFVKKSGPNSFRRFGTLCAGYIDAIIREAEMRERGEVLNLQSYNDHRRQNSAIPLSFGVFEYALGIDLPDEVFKDETFMKMYWAAVDMITWSNDLYSYKKEQAQEGHDANNVVTVLMKDKNISLQEASDYIGEVFQSLMNQYTSSKSCLRSWSPQIDRDINRFASAMEYWVSGNLNWSFETPRYFGRDGEEVKHTRVVNLA